MKIIFTRHATTPWNLEKRLQGHTDIPIEEFGIREAEKLAEVLAVEKIDYIYSSNLKRAVQTAQIIAKARKLSVQEDARLRECSFGMIEGHTVEEAIMKFGESVFHHDIDDFSAYDLRAYGGENRDDVLGRHLSFLNEARVKHSSETILIVGHGRSLNTLLFAMGHSVNLKRGEYRKIDY